MIDPEDQAKQGEHDLASDSQAATDAQRRAALRRLGPLAVLTPPALMALLASPRASAESLGQPPGEDKI